MKPNFALSLSFEGIRLLHRVSGGWHLVGEVAIDDAKLADSLALLRQKAIQLDSSGFHTKLIIPSDQIKFTTIDTAQTGIDDVRAALDGATPYPIDDLVIDFDRTGGRTYIAAVARETLVEAEHFAKEHNFAPVAFVADAEPFTFRSEVFFGATSSAKEVLAKNQSVERDDKPIKVIGSSGLNEPDTIDDSEPVIDVQTDAITEVTADGSDEVGANTDGSEIDDANSVEKEDAQEENGPNVPLFGTRREQTATAPSAAPALGSAIVSAPAENTFDPETTVSAPASVSAPRDGAAFASRRADATTSKAATHVVENVARARPKLLGLILTAGLVVFLILVALWAGSLSDAGVAGWFGAEDEQVAVVEIAETIEVPSEESVSEVPIVEIETVEPETSDEITVAAAPQEQPAQLPVAESPTGSLPILRESVGRVLSPAEANRIYAATGVYQRAPRLPLTPRTSTLDGLERAVSRPTPTKLAALPLPELTLMLPDPNIVTPTNPPAAGVTFARDLRGFILATPEGTTTPDGVVVFAGAPEKVPPFRPGTEVSDVAVERPLTGGNAPLVLIAGRPPKSPPPRPDGLAPVPNAVADTASVDSNILSQAEGLIVLSGAPAKTPPQRPEGLAPETIAEPAPDELAEAEPEIAEVIAEQTDSIEINPQNVTTSNGTNLANYRPSVRPQGLVPEPAVDFLALADPALAGNRPALRPASIVPTLPVPETDISAVIAALAEVAPDSPTAQAVARSTRPDSRPRNFSQVVASARRNPQATVTSSAPAISSGPIPGGVARAATVENAIRLRDINLIGVFGRGNDRRALVRLGNGRFVRVQVGSDLDGGKVTAIGDSALNYVKRGRTYALELPTG